MSDSKFLKVVYKYPFKVSDCVALALPKGAKLLTIQEQAGVACAWAIVDPEETRRETVVVHVRGTGHPIETYPEQGVGEYFCTFQMSGGALVFHAFLEAVE